MTLGAELQPEQLAKRLEACAICLGYLTESGRYEVRDTILPECRSLVAMLASTGAAGEARALGLATGHPDPWVRFYVAINLARDFSAIALKVFQDLRAIDGLVSAQAVLAIHQLGQHGH